MFDIINVVYTGGNQKGKLFRRTGGEATDILVKRKCTYQGYQQVNPFFK